MDFHLTLNRPLFWLAYFDLMDMYLLDFCFVFFLTYYFIYKSGYSGAD